MKEEGMSEELGQYWKEDEQKDAGADELERSERSERSESESAPAARPAEEGGPAADENEDTVPVRDEQGEESTASIAEHSVPAAQPGADPQPVGDDEWDAPWRPREESTEPAQGNDEPAPLPPNLKARRRGTLSKPKPPHSPLTPQQKLLLLDTWQRSGLPARDFGAMVNVSRHTLYAWKRRFEQLGPAGLMEQPRGSKRGSRLPELTKRTILMLKVAHPEWGCQRISDMLLRGPALPASPAAVARVLHEAGYEMEEQATRPHPPRQVRSFERAKPNELWQTDLFTFMLKRQNRRVYLVAFMDDHSRFITGYGLHASQSAALVLEVVRAAIAAHGVPTEILTDNGSQYVTWRGKSQFTREMEKRGIKQIVARPRRPQTLGKIERFWGSLWRECVETAVFLDLADARQRIGLWIDYYNLQRPHQGIEGLVPADRFFYAAPAVLKTLKERAAENASELARNGIPKKPFYLTGQVEGQPFSIHREGDRVILRRAGKEREDIDLMAARPSETPPAPSGETEDALPPSVCPDGSPATLWQHQSRDPAPGTSPLDEIPTAGDEDEVAQPDEDESCEEGGDA